MQIVFHIGAHCTDEGQILSCLAQNRQLLAGDGIFVPPPGKFRPILRESLQVLNGRIASADFQAIMLDSILAKDRPQRVIFSNDASLGGVQQVLASEQFYPDCGAKCLRLANLFDGQDVEFALSIRNPATFLPACFARTGGQEFEAYYAQTDPLTLRWSNVLKQIAEAVPGVPIRVWSNEDTPFIWPELMRDICDLNAGAPLAGLDDFLAEIMMPEGLDRMESYLGAHPPANEIQRRRILSAFLDKFEIDDPTLEVEANGWTTQLVDALTDQYEEDLFVIERMPGVQFISP